MLIQQAKADEEQNNTRTYKKIYFYFMCDGMQNYQSSTSEDHKISFSSSCRGQWIRQKTQTILHSNTQGS